MTERPNLGLLTKREVIEVLVAVNPEYSRTKLNRRTRDELIEQHRVKLTAHFLAHKCATGAPDMADNDQHRPAPTRHPSS